MSGLRSSSWIYLTVLTAMLLVACSAGVTPEQEIRALLLEAEIAAEERDVGDFSRLISPQYGDQYGHDKDELLRLLRLQMIRNQVIYLWLQIAEINVISDASAEATVRVAMAGGPLHSFEDLARLGAELYRFELELVKESGKWRIARAAWDHALETDFGF